MFSSTVFRGQKSGRSRTDDSGVPDVIPFLKASLLKFVSVTSSPSTAAFVFRSSLCVEVAACIGKSKLLYQGM